MTTNTLPLRFTAIVKVLAFVATLAVASGSALAADDHGNTKDTATPITVGVWPPSNISAQLEAAGDVDFFTFTVASKGQVMLAAHRGGLSPQMPTVTSLLDSSGNVIVATYGSTAVVRAIPAGTYFVSVTTTGGSTGKYVLIPRFVTTR